MTGNGRVGEPLIAASGIWKIFGPKAERILVTPDADLARAELRRLGIAVRVSALAG